MNKVIRKHHEKDKLLNKKAKESKALRMYDAAKQ